jgi:hypothetical protein
MGQADPFQAQKDVVAALKDRANRLPGPTALQILTSLQICERLIGSRVLGWEQQFEDCAASINRKLEQYEGAEPPGQVPSPTPSGAQVDPSSSPSSRGGIGTTPLVVGGVAAGALLLVGLLS